MTRLTILYARRDGARFDAAYYCDRHLPLARQLLGPFGLQQVQADVAISGLGGTPAPFAGIGHFCFESMDGLHAALQAAGAQLAADVANFTDLQPQFQISDVVER